MELSTYTEELFRDTDPGNSGMLILVSGSFNEAHLNTGSWDTGSWNFNSGSVTGSMSNGSVVGVILSNIDNNGSSNLLNFKVCEKLSCEVRTSEDSMQMVVLDILDRKFYSGYTYFKVKKSLEEFTASLSFSSKGDTYLNYVCPSGENVLSIINISPFIDTLENSNFNPVINNVSESVQNSFTKNVEQQLNGKIVLNTSASIVDSYYTSVANTSGRFLGSKNNYITSYIGEKERYTEDNIKILSESVSAISNKNFAQTGKDRTFYTTVAFEGAYFPSGSDLGSMSLSDMTMENLAFAQGAIFMSTGSGYLNLEGQGALPKLGDILYSVEDPDTGKRHRLTSGKVYSKDLAKTLEVNDKGHVISVQ